MIGHRAVFNAVRDAIFVADIGSGMILDANPAAEALCGRSLDELRLLHHTMLHPPDRADLARRVFQGHVLAPAITEGVALHKDGRRIPVEISSSTFAAPDGRPMMIGVFRDTTEPAAAREALRKSEERFRQVAASAGEFIWEVDANGLYTYASPVVEEILGYQPEEIVGRKYFYDFFVPETRDEIKQAAFAVFARQEAFRTFPNWNLRKDGSRVLLETSGLPIIGDERKLLGYRGADVDVTERKLAEDLLRALAGSLLTAQEDERRRVSRELHDDITQRLAFLSIELGKLSAEKQESPEVERARLRTLQEQTLQIAAEVRRLSHGLHPSVIEDFGLSIALEEFCQEFGAARGIRVAFDGFLEDSQLEIASATCLYRVAQECLNNAVLHGHATEIRVDLSTDDGAIHMRVRDNGAGFNPEIAASRTSLGLISMRERLRFVRGRLAISSRPGHGAEIVATVPLHGVCHESHANPAG